MNQAGKLAGCGTSPLAGFCSHLCSRMALHLLQRQPQGKQLFWGVPQIQAKAPPGILSKPRAGQGVQEPPSHSSSPWNSPHGVSSAGGNLKAGRCRVRAEHHELVNPLCKLMATWAQPSTFIAMAPLFLNLSMPNSSSFWLCQSLPSEALLKTGEKLLPCSTGLHHVMSEDSLALVNAVRCISEGPKQVQR